jgi:tRNA (guanine-N7-)-methyltransferase
MSRSRPSIDISTYLIDSGQPTDGAAINWTLIFGNANPVELEIGSGKGLFLANAARANPAHDFLGIELSRKYAQLAAQRLARAQIPNAKVWRGDAGAVIGRLVPAASVRAIHIYFPDPWWKRRHKKRRVFTSTLVSSLERALEPGGELRVASDVAEYFKVIQCLIAANPRFRERPMPAPEASPETADFLTSFERKYRLEGRAIHRADYVLEPADRASAVLGPERSSSPR